MYEKIWQEAENIQLNGSGEKEIINILFSKDNLDADKVNLFKGKLTFRTLIEVLEKEKNNYNNKDDKCLESVAKIIIKLEELDNEININELKKNYSMLEESFCSEWPLEFRRHQVSRGKYAELNVKSFLERIIPKKFIIIENAFIINGEGKLSPECDLIICSLEYMPPIFENKSMKYIPMEGVIAIVQVKIGDFKKQDISNHVKKIDDIFYNHYDKFKEEKIIFGSVVGEKRMKKTKNIFFKPITILFSGSLSECKEYDFCISVEEKKIKYEHKKYSSRLQENEKLPSKIVSKEGYLSFMLDLNEELIKINNPNIFDYNQYRKVLLCKNKEEDLV